MIKKGFYAGLLFLLAFPTLAQILLPGTSEASRYQINLLKQDSIKSLASRRSINYPDSTDYFSILNPFTQFSFNSAYARSYNDGAVWKGKGITQELHAGIQLKTNAFHLTFYPVIYYSQNSSYPLSDIRPSRHPYNYQFGLLGDIDFVQRYGNESFIHFHPGQSEMAITTKHLRVAATTQNFTLGPAVVNHIIMSNSGGGFPHLDIGTSKKQKLKFRNIDLGAIDANLFWGLLSESDYFDNTSSNDTRYINGMSIGYEVPYLKGITLGFQKALYKDTRFFNNTDLISNFYIRDTNIIGDSADTWNDTFDQIASAFIEWNLKDEDLRLYFEFARNDFNGSFRRFLTEFEHGRAYTIGLEKIFTLPRQKEVHLLYEHTYLPLFHSYKYRPAMTYYTHQVNRQGYTHQGQLLGAGIGPGSVSDYLRLIILKNSTTWGLTFQRIRFDEDYFLYTIQDDLTKIGKHDIEYTAGFNFSKKYRKLECGYAMNMSYRFNMYYENNNDKVNLSGNVFASYRIK